VTLTAEQLELRRQGVGASEVAAIVGVNPYANVWDVYNTKTGVVTDEIDNIHTRLGHALEPMLINEYRERAGREVEYPCTTLVHPEFSWAMATPDGLVGNDGVVECKVAGWRMRDKWGPEGSDEVPDEYLIQCAWQLAVTDRLWVELIVLLDRDVKIYRIDRNMALERKLVQQVKQFWHKNVLVGIPPEVDGSDGARTFFEKHHPEPSEEVIPAVPATEKLAEDLHSMQQLIKKTKAKAAEIKQQFMGVIADRRGIQTSLGKVLWYRTKARAKTNWEAVAVAAGASDELIAQHTTITQPNRTFRATLKREGDE